MNVVIMLLMLVSICSAGRMYAMEEETTRADKNLQKAQKFFNKAEDVLSELEIDLAMVFITQEEEYSMHVAARKAKANDLVLRGKRYVTAVLNDNKADQLTKEKAFDIEKSIDGIMSGQ